MIEIRKALAEELPIVREIAYQTWPETFFEILSPPQIEYMLNMMYNLKTLESHLSEKGQVFLLAEEEGEFLGFAAYELNYSEREKAKLHKIYVLPSAQGKGLGKKLIHEVSDQAKAKGQKSLLLNVNKFNQPAIDFYAYLGFKEAYREVIDIGNGYVMDDVVMELNL
ncbi:MAG: GNAT family N-acetyltransferase [Algoriphagus sp.]|nr:GNAT family N-acetyltransferase [Algoriphagus sp.]